MYLSSRRQYLDNLTPIKEDIAIPHPKRAPTDARTRTTTTQLHEPTSPSPTTRLPLAVIEGSQNRVGGGDEGVDGESDGGVVIVMAVSFICCIS
jgi:hypothetical protein